MPRAKKTPAVSKTFAPKFWSEVDGRFGIAKEIRRRYETLRDATGADQSPQKDMLVQRAVYLSVCLETMETESLESGKFDLGPYTQGCNALQGLLKNLGLEKKVKTAIDLKSYLAEVEAAK